MSLAPTAPSRDEGATTHFDRLPVTLVPVNIRHSLPPARRG